MRFALPRSPLLTAVTSAHGIVERRPAVPVLSHLLLEAKQDEITLRATDLDHTFTARIPASVETPGTAIVLVQTLYDALRKTGEVDTLGFFVNEEGSRLTLKAGRSRFNLTILQEATFPEEGAFSAATSFKLATLALKQLIDKTRFSVSTEETRYALNGIYMHTTAEDTVLRAAATDSHRLAVTAVPFKESASLSMILSRKTVTEATKLLDKSEGEVSVSVSAAQIRLDFGNEILTARLVDGEFPNYTRVIPERSTTFFDVDRKKFIESVDRASIIADDTVRIVKLKLQEDLLRIFSVQHELGTAEDEVDVLFKGSTSWEASFNARYLLEAAEHIDGDKIRVYITDALAPVLMERPEDSATSFVVMPMRM
ncbi:MAG: DNA polymerase III subunit beta [Holosporales bacterium]|jgi:DNA polymerase-3 subunit beta|nr:DNA polymerase III subunit beta [Holosporales bacterium]